VLCVMGISSAATSQPAVAVPPALLLPVTRRVRAVKKASTKPTEETIKWTYAVVGRAPRNLETRFVRYRQKMSRRQRRSLKQRSAANRTRHHGTEPYHQRLCRPRTQRVVGRTIEQYTCVWVIYRDKDRHGKRDKPAPLAGCVAGRLVSCWHHSAIDSASYADSQHFGRVAFRYCYAARRCCPTSATPWAPKPKGRCSKCQGKG
jgi:hypothetical protein